MAEDRVTGTPERALASAACDLGWDDLPPHVVGAAGTLFGDWLGSALAGSRSSQVDRLMRAAERGGLAARVTPARSGERGTATALATLARAPSLVAALLNAASSHVEEMDDLHNESIYHPGTCVFPAALAVAEAENATPRSFLVAAVAGYEVSLRIGQALGPEHYRFFHTTGTAGTFGAAVAAGHLLGLDGEGMLSALGNAGTQAAGLWQFLADGAMSKQLHPAKAAFNGVLAAYLASEGFTGTAEILLGERALLSATARDETVGESGQAALRERQRRALMAGLQERAEGPPGAHRFAAFKTTEVSIKYHASCRHTHAAVDALLLAMREHHVAVEDVGAIHAHVNSAAYALLKDVTPSNTWAAKFSIPFCLARAALDGGLGVDAFSPEALGDPRVVDLMRRVTVDVDPALDAGYPRRWAAVVDVETASGAVYRTRVEAPKGDPDNALSTAELDDKFRSLARLALDDESVEHLAARLDTLVELGRMSDLLRDLRPRRESWRLTL